MHKSLTAYNLCSCTRSIDDTTCSAKGKDDKLMREYTVHLSQVLCNSFILWATHTSRSSQTFATLHIRYGICHIGVPVESNCYAVVNTNIYFVFVALIKSIGLRPDARTDDRCYWLSHVLSISMSLSIPTVYPRMFSIHDLSTKVFPNSFLMIYTI